MTDTPDDVRWCTSISAVPRFVRPQVNWHLPDAAPPADTPRTDVCESDALQLAESLRGVNRFGTQFTALTHKGSNPNYTRLHGAINATLTWMYPSFRVAGNHTEGNHMLSMQAPTRVRSGRAGWARR